MKHYLMLFLLLGMMSIYASAQKVSADRMESDGAHQIMTETKEYTIGSAKYNFGLKVYEYDTHKDWLLLISSYYYIPNSSEILLKLGNDEIEYLPVNNVHVGKITMPGYGFVIGSVISTSPSRDADYYSAIYDISTDLLAKIEEFGIKKIRISNGVEYRDKSFKSNSLGKYLTKCYKTILKRIANPVRKKGLFEDF